MRRSKRGLAEPTDAELQTEIRRVVDAMADPEAAETAMVNQGSAEKARAMTLLYYAEPDALIWSGTRTARARPGHTTASG